VALSLQQRTYIRAHMNNIGCVRVEMSAPNPPQAATSALNREFDQAKIGQGSTVLGAGGTPARQGLGHAGWESMKRMVSQLTAAAVAA